MDYIYVMSYAETINDTDVPVNLSRDEIVTMLENERQRAVSLGDSRLVAMYDNVIHNYATTLKQNRGNKYVRMADGSRRWVTNEEARALLDKPRKERV